MGRELLIMRHAKSDWGNSTGDFDRPLNPRGNKAAPRMGRWLKEHDLVPDYVISSPAVRAWQTTCHVCAELAINTDSAVGIVVQDRRIYEASLGTLLQVLEGAAAARVLLVGHNPGLEYLLIHLARSIPPPPDNNLLPTATLVRLAMPDDWRELQPDAAELRSLIRPRELMPNDAD